MSGDHIKSGIYKITNTVNGKCYVGSAVNLAKRLTNHKCHLKKGTHKNPKLQSSWVKYGSNAFIFEVIELVKEKTDLLSREQYYIDRLKPSFNIARIAGSNLGKIVTYESRRKMSESGKHRPPVTEETRAKLSASAKRIGVSPQCIEAAKRARTGSKHTDESRRKISENQIGKEISARQRALISAALYNVHARRTPEEQKMINAKISATKKRVYAAKGGLL